MSRGGVDSRDLLTQLPDIEASEVVDVGCAIVEWFKGSGLRPGGNGCVSTDVGR